MSMVSAPKRRQTCTTPPFFGFLGWHLIIWDGSQHKIIPNLDHEEKGGIQDNADGFCLHQGGIGEFNSVFLLNMPWQMVRLWPTEFEAFCLSTSFDLSIFVFPAPSLPQHPSERGRRAGRASWSGSILQTAARVFLQCARQAGPPVTERLAQAVLNCSTPISTPPAPKSEPTSFMPRRYFNPRVIKGLVAIEKAQSRPGGGRPPVRVRPKDGIN